jgi:hypothetical protein
VAFSLFRPRILKLVHRLCYKVRMYIFRMTSRPTRSIGRWRSGTE